MFGLHNKGLQKCKRFHLSLMLVKSGVLFLMDSKLSKEWLMLEKDQQLSEEKEACKGERERESLEESCSRSSPDQRAYKTSLSGFAS